MRSEKEVISDCLKGDKKAQHELYKKYAPVMFGICLRYCKTRAEAEDVLQDAFVRIFSHLGSYRHEGSFEGWMKRTVVHTALNYYKSNLKRCFDQSIDDMHEGAVPAEDTHDASLSADVLMHMINGLADGFRVVFNMYAIEGYSHKEIAAILNISEGTSKSQLSRARAILQEKVNAHRKIYV